MPRMPFCGLWRLCLLNCTLTLATSLQRVDLENHTWANYFLAAYKVSVFSPCTDLTALALFSTQSIAQFAVKVFLQGVFEFLDKKGKAPSPAGLQVMLHGQVPTGECLLLKGHSYDLLRDTRDTHFAACLCPDSSLLHSLLHVACCPAAVAVAIFALGTCISSWLAALTIFPGSIACKDVLLHHSHRYILACCTLQHQARAT